MVVVLFIGAWVLTPGFGDESVYLVFHRKVDDGTMDQEIELVEMVPEHWQQV